MKKAVIYNFVVALALLVVVELATRLISLASGQGFFLAIHEVSPEDEKIKQLYQWHPSAGYVFRPSITFRGSHFRQEGHVYNFTDTNGFLVESRQAVVPLEKAENEIRIAVIGASTSANVNLGYHRNWPGLLQAQLQRDYPNKLITLINAAVPGYDTSQSIPNLAMRVMPFKPDVVIIYHAYNDLKAIRPDLAFKPDYSHIHNSAYGVQSKLKWYERLISKSMFLVRARQLMLEQKNLQADHAVQRTSSIPPEFTSAFETNMRSLLGIARQGGAKVILSTFATLHEPGREWILDETIFDGLTDMEGHELVMLERLFTGLTIKGVFAGVQSNNQVIRDIAVSNDVALVDAARLVPHEDPYFIDRVHFSAQGSVQLATAMYQQLTKVVAELVE